ncbi:hypothetical protein [Streptomyces soliscabiei]|uniref:hypothetical protein n=1 Tax=Streptomyces soliscabiei TaxID=588897 RepID=UPI0029A8FD88|nr:hypothetical protein [Streptomyces sp. NY05-11A]MDX2681956.1 hypothetical protein [Streptomyces sp. NY05-11A]
MNISLSVWLLTVAALCALVAVDFFIGRTTPMLVVMLAIGSTDVLFALDSIPAAAEPETGALRDGSTA